MATPTPNEEAHLLSFIRASSAVLAFHNRLSPRDMGIMRDLLTYILEISLKPHFQVTRPDLLVTSDRFDSRSKCPEAFYLLNLNLRTVSTCPYRKPILNAAFHHIKTELQKLTPGSSETLCRAINIPGALSFQPWLNIERLEREVKSIFMAHSFIRKPGSASGDFYIARSYSISDLLSMRRWLPYVICDVKRLERNSDAGLLRVPRQAYADPQHYTCKSSAIKQIVDYEQRPQTPGDHLSSDEEDIVYRGHPRRNNVRHYQWCFRRETSADRPTQPISAPTGVEAQKAENFKKFYQAVVSPTHIRVTAGGRIVPNTRTLPQPIFTWNHETLRFESGNLSPKDPQPWLQGAVIELATPSLQLGLPFPQPMVFGGFLRTQASINAANTSSQQAVTSGPGAFQEMSSLSGNTSMAPGGQSSTAPGGQSNEVQGGVTLSPPTQFDTTKPFVLNGRLVYPLPPGFQVPSNVPVLPLNILTNATASHQAFGPPMPPCSMTNPSITGTMAPHMAQFPGLVPGYVPANFSALNLPANFAPHTLSTLDQLVPNFPWPVPIDVDTIENHIHSVKQQLKFIGHELENNNHQIDVRQLEDKHKLAQMRLDSLRGMLVVISQPNSAYRALHPPASVAQIQMQLTMPNVAKNVSTTAPMAFTNAEQIAVRPNSLASDEKLPKKNEASAAASPQKSEFPPSKETGVRNRLSAAAAMAPPFQPRFQQQVVPQWNDHDNGLSPNNVIKSGESKLAIQPLGASNVGNWMTPAPSGAVPHGPPHHLQTSSLNYLPHLPNTRAMSGFTSSGNLSVPVQEVHQSNVSVPIASGREGVQPYLTGFTAPGVAIDQVDSKDLVYARPLTEEEIRARHLYWGKAPKEVLKGLPKFDGRNFYPPSPVKNFTVPVSFNSPSHNHQASDLNTSMGRGTLIPAYEPNQQISYCYSAGDPFHEYDKRNATPTEKEYENLEEDDTETASLDSWGAPKFSIKNLKLLEAEAARAARAVSTKSSGGKDKTVPKVSKDKPDFHAQGSSSFLRSMLKNGSGGGLSGPLGGALSSATAQGSLPQYQGAAAASLAPSLKNGHYSAQKFNTDPHHTRRSGRNSKASLRTENRAPLTITQYEEFRAADLLRRIQDGDAAAVSPGWNVNTTGVGPISGPDW